MVSFPLSRRSDLISSSLSCTPSGIVTPTANVLNWYRLASLAASFAMPLAPSIIPAQTEQAAADTISIAAAPPPCLSAQVPHSRYTRSAAATLLVTQAPHHLPELATLAGLHQGLHLLVSGKEFAHVLLAAPRTLGDALEPR